MRKLAALSLLQVVSPYNSEDAKGLLKAAIFDPNPSMLNIDNNDNRTLTNLFTGMLGGNGFAR